MGTRTIACLFALTLVTPFAFASGSTTISDPQGDEFSRVLLAPDAARLCDAPSADIANLVLDSSGSTLVATLTLRDAAAPMVCGDASFGAPTQRFASFHLNNPLYDLSFHVSGNPEAGVRSCWELRAYPDAHVGACEQKAWGEDFVGNAWTTTVPLRGTATSFTGGSVAYDLRDQAYAVGGAVNTGYGLRGVVAGSSDSLGFHVYEP